MNVNFYKYHGAGNDFIIINDLEKSVYPRLDETIISSLCSRRTGIGADGLILIHPDSEVDFEMVYFNADGRLSSMCGNGGRCSAWFAYAHGIAKKQMEFKAVDGVHAADCIGDHYVKLEMRPAKVPEIRGEDYVINTGSPHYVKFVDSLDFDIVTAAKEIRYSDLFKIEGINVNFVKIDQHKLAIRTYERGVEDETLSCGTGVTACALVWSMLQKEEPKHIDINAVGGQLKVQYDKISNGYFTDVWLAGPVKRVFEGVLML